MRSMSATANNLPLPVRADDFERNKGSNDGRILTSLPHRRQPAFNDNIDEEFFKLDEEEEEQQRRPVNFYTDDISELDDNDDLFHQPVEEEVLEEDEESTPQAKTASIPTFIPGSMPIQIARPARQDVNVNGVEQLVPLKKLEKDMDTVDEEQIEKVLEGREQAMFRNMQRLSFSVQPEDGPERLWGHDADWEDERRRRRCSFNPTHYEGEVQPHPTNATPTTSALSAAAKRAAAKLAAAKFATTAPGPRIHTPREAALVFRPRLHDDLSPGQVKRPGQLASNPFGGQPPAAPRRVEAPTHPRAFLPSAAVSGAERSDQQSRARTDTVDGIQRQPKM